MGMSSYIFTEDEIKDRELNKLKGLKIFGYMIENESVIINTNDGNYKIKFFCDSTISLVHLIKCNINSDEIVDGIEAEKIFISNHPDGNHSLIGLNLKFGNNTHSINFITKDLDSEIDIKCIKL